MKGFKKEAAFFSGGRANPYFDTCPWEIRRRVFEGPGCDTGLNCSTRLIRVAWQRKLGATHVDGCEILHHWLKPLSVGLCSGLDSFQLGLEKNGFPIQPTNGRLTVSGNRNAVKSICQELELSQELRQRPGKTPLRFITFSGEPREQPPLLRLGKTCTKKAVGEIKHEASWSPKGHLGCASCAPKKKTVKETFRSPHAGPGLRSNTCPMEVSVKFSDQIVGSLLVAGRRDRQNVLQIPGRPILRCGETCILLLLDIVRTCRGKAIKSSPHTSWTP